MMNVTPYPKTQCKNCGKEVVFYQDQHITQCDCGAGILNPEYMFTQQSVRLRTDCLVCDDSGLVLIPISGDLLYSSVARCKCKKGDEISKKIPEIPTKWYDVGKNKNDFFTRRQTLLKGFERSLQKQMEDKKDG